MSTKIAFNQIEGAVINVRDFGAVGDGVTDDTAAIQAAIDALTDGDTLRFPKATYRADSLSIVDKGNLLLDFQGSVLEAVSGTPDHIIRIENTTSSFMRGPVFQDLTLDGVAVSGIKVVGGAWTNMEFRRVFSDTLVATNLIYHFNYDAVARNPSNFIFETVWNKSFDVQHLINYSGDTGTSVDNFSYAHLLHWSNQVTPSTVIYSGLSGAQYCTYRNIYGALYATGAAVIDSGTNSITRSNIQQVLMEGTQDGREAVAGNYVECKLHNIVNFYDESSYNTNYAVNAKVQDSELFNCLLQDSGSGYSTLPSVVLKALSRSSTLHHCNTVTDNGTGNTVLEDVPAYEEGSFTPSLELGGASTGITYTTQTGWYSKVGNTINYAFTLILSSKGTATGAAVVQGLPYTSKAGTTTGGAINLVNTTFADVPQLIIDSATSTVRLREVNTLGTASNLDDTNLTNSSVIICTGTYFV